MQLLQLNEQRLKQTRQRLTKCRAKLRLSASWSAALCHLHRDH